MNTPKRTDAEKFKHLIALKGTTLEALASVIGVDRSTLYRRLREGTDGFTVSEALKISRYLRLSTEEALEIFWHISPERLIFVERTPKDLAAGGRGSRGGVTAWL